MVATTGAKLLPTEALTALREKLLPLTTIVTPNFPEASLMWGEYTGNIEEQPQPATVGDFEAFVKKFAEIAPEWVLVKGGHCPFTRDGKAAKSEEEKEVVVDLLYRRGTLIKFESPYQSSKHTHGTGCSLACKPPSLDVPSHGATQLTDGALQLRLLVTWRKEKTYRKQ
jgi:hydroxymethylpyrimidine/phosphomethylpyrimidine kinase